MTALAESLQKNRSLQYLALDNNQISQQLGKSGCMVGTYGQNSVKQFIWSMYPIHFRVLVSYNRGARLGVAALAKTLQKNRVLQQLLVILFAQYFYVSFRPQNACHLLYVQMIVRIHVFVAGCPWI